MSYNNIMSYQDAIENKIQAGFYDGWRGVYAPGNLYGALLSAYKLGYRQAVAIREK